MHSRTKAKLLGGVVAIALSTLPILVSAQEVQQMSDRDILRSEIRAAILNDPRSLELPDSELTALVELLAGEAEEQQIASDFMPPPSTFAEYVAPLLTPWGSPISVAALFVVVLLCLGLALLLLQRLLAHHAQPAPGVTMPSQPPMPPAAV